MIAAKRQAPARTIDDRTTVDSLHVPGRPTITRGTELHVDGIRGRVAFVSHTRRTDGAAEWCDVLTAAGHMRYVHPDKIRTVHKSRKLGVLGR